MGMTRETLAILGELAQNPLEVAKVFNQALGLVNYNLERPAKSLVPVITPLRNMIARTPSEGGNAVHWKAITGINTSDVVGVVEEGKRSGAITTTLKDYTAPYATVGLEDYITFSAKWAAKGFEDAQARMIRGLLWATMIAEEHCILGMNRTKLLGVSSKPTLSTDDEGGSIPDAVNVVVCVLALTYDGWRTATVTGGARVTTSRTNADGTTTAHGGYCGQISATTTQATGAEAPHTHSVLASWDIVRGAVAYALYWGPTAGAAQTLGAIVTTNSYIITTATGAGTQAANATGLDADNSLNAYGYDGLISIIAGAGPEDSAMTSGALWQYQETGVVGVGTCLSTDSRGGIVEFETDLKAFWDNYRLSPDIALVSSQELGTITSLIIGAGGTALFRFVLDGKSPDQIAAAVAGRTIQGGTVVGTYLNKYSMNGGSLMKVMLHPTVPPGTIIYWSSQVPYPLSDVTNLLEMDVREEYHEIDWPMITRKFEAGVYVDETLKCYFPAAFGMRTNIAPLS